jgi:hypothetical protein
MIRNEVDDFRAAFFDRVVQVEQERERVVRRKQANCFHRYVASTGTVGAQRPLGPLGPVMEPFVTLQCVLCQHTIVRHRKLKA